MQLLYSILKVKGINVEYHLNPGRHDFDYWNNNIEECMLFDLNANDNNVK